MKQKLAVVLATTLVGLPWALLGTALNGDTRAAYRITGYTLLGFLALALTALSLPQAAVATYALGNVAVTARAIRNS